MKIHNYYKYLVLIIALIGAGSIANATTVEPGTIRLGGGLGPGLKLGEKLGGSNSYLMLNANGEYSISQNISGTMDLEIGLANTIPIVLRAGIRYRLTGLDLPLSPYAQLELNAGRLLNVLGANLSIVGIGVGVGADYLLTSKLAAGIVTRWNLNTTLGVRPAYYGVWQLLCTASYAISI